MKCVGEGMSVNALLIPLSGGIALSFGGCADSVTPEEQLRDNLLLSCQVSAACDEDFSEDYRDVEECTDYYDSFFGAALSTYESDECRSRFLKYLNCAANIARRAYQAHGCSYDEHLGEFGAERIEDEDGYYYLACRDEYDALFEPPCDYYDEDDCFRDEDGDVWCTNTALLEQTP